jgi:hypothetical protein
VSVVTDPTTDEKIELLVRSVLEAVDARLDAVRHEIAGFAADVEQRHHLVLESVAALDARVSDLADLHTGSDAVTAEIAALRNEVTDLRARTITAMVPAANATVTGSHPITQAELDEISRPFVTPPITTQVPIVPDPNAVHDESDHDAGNDEPMPHMPLTVPPSAVPTFAPAHSSTAHASTVHASTVHASTVHDSDAAPSGEDSIDLDQLASLLHERLGHMSLPMRPD